MGALGVALGKWSANLSSHKRGWDERWEEFSYWAEKGRAFQDELIFLIDEDTRAFNAIMKPFQCRKKLMKRLNLRRNKAIQDATKYAIEIPFRIMETAFGAFGLIRAMVEKGNPNSVTDACVGALAIRSCIIGAYMNVRVNVGNFDDTDFSGKIVAKAEKIKADAIEMEKEIVELAESKI
jgi:glutamate formiminotransferase / formiminotetrahydrofolate cyclodeaminase